MAHIYLRNFTFRDVFAKTKLVMIQWNKLNFITISLFSVLISKYCN